MSIFSICFIIIFPFISILFRFISIYHLAFLARTCTRCVTGARDGGDTVSHRVVVATEDGKAIHLNCGGLALALGLGDLGPHRGGESVGDRADLTTNWMVNK